MITNFKQDRLYGIKQTLPKNLARFYLENIKKVKSPYRDYNHKYKCIFIHIPKTAGTSLGRTIFENRDPSVSHVDAFYYEVFEPQLFREYFKFTFVRNPWDRLVSNYNYFLKQPSQLREKQFLDTFENFDHFANALEKPEVEQKMFTMYHFRPQYQFICDLKRNLVVDYLGYFETINEDFNKIVARLNRPELQLPHLNESKKGLDYREFYTEKTKKIVEKLYPEDIKLFGYNFDGIVKKVNV